MKTINGNNKTERLINKAKKYLGIEFSGGSNKYWRVDVNTLNNSHYIVSSSSVDLVNTKYGERLKIKPINAIDGKCYWVPSWKAMEITYWDSHLFLIQVNEKDINEFLELAKGCDDVMLAQDYAKTQDIMVSKNAFRFQQVFSILNK